MNTKLGSWAVALKRTSGPRRPQPPTLTAGAPGDSPSSSRLDAGTRRPRAGRRGQAECRRTHAHHYDSRRRVLLQSLPAHLSHFKILLSFFKLERHTPRTRPRHCHPRLAQFTGIPRAFHAVTSTCAVALRNCGRAAPRAPEISQGFWHAARLERRFPFFIFLSSEAFGPIVLQFGLHVCPPLAPGC